MRLRELQIRYIARPGSNDARPTRIESPRDAAAILTSILEDEAVEVMGLLCLTTTHRIIGYHELGRGVLDACLVHPREVFKVAMLANAACVVLAHNHPSGDPTPSPEDVTLTSRLQEAGQLLGIDVLDHLVIGHGGRYTSFQETGRLPDSRAPIAQGGHREQRRQDR